MRVASLYCRVSTERQAEEATIESQVAELQTYAREHEYRILTDGIFLDNGFSGSSLVRPGLDQLRDRAVEGVFEAVLIHSPDRLARKYAHQVLLLEELKQLGIEVVFLNRANAHTPEDELLLQVQGMIAEYEKAKIIERSRRGKIHRAREGSVSVLSGAPYGYLYICKQDGRGARYEIIETEAEVIRTIFQWYVEEQLSIGEITRRLSAQAIATRRGKQWWDRSTVWGILRNPAYMGRAHYRKTEAVLRQKITKPARQDRFYPKHSHSSSKQRPVQDWIGIEVPAIITAEQFAQAQEQLVKNQQLARRHNSRYQYLLRGLVVCQQCGYAMYGKPTSNSRYQRCYYRCTGHDAFRFGGQRLCEGKAIRVDYLDHLVWQKVAELLQHPGLILEEYDRRQNLNQNQDHWTREKLRLEGQLKKAEAERQRLLDAYQAGLVDLEELKRRSSGVTSRSNQLREKLKQLIQQQEQAEQEKKIIEQLTSFLTRVKQGVNQLSFEEKQKIVRLLVNRVEVNGENITIKHSIPTPNSSMLPLGPRSKNTALGYSTEGLVEDPIFQVSGLEQIIEQAQKAIVRETLSQDRQHEVTIQTLEALRDVSFNEPACTTPFSVDCL